MDTLASDPALLLIVVGSVMFLTTFLGCAGALRNAPCLLKTVERAAAGRAAGAWFTALLLVSLQFLAILAAVVLLQVAAAVLAHLFTDVVASPPSRSPRRSSLSLSRR